MNAVEQVYAEWKEKHPPSHTSRSTASITFDKSDPQKFVNEFIRFAERDYPNHQISGEVTKDANNGIVGKVIFDPVVAP